MAHFSPKHSGTNEEVSHCKQTVCQLPYHKNFQPWKGRVRGGPRKFSPSSSFIAVQNLFAICHTVWACVGGSTNLGALMPDPCDKGRI